MNPRHPSDATRARVLRRVFSWALLFGLLFPPPARAEDLPQRLRFQVALGRDMVLEDLSVELDRLGTNYVVPLSDDGTAAGDMPWDGVYVGEHLGGYARFVGLYIVAVEPGAEPRIIYTGLECTEDARSVDLGWRLQRQTDESLGAVRVAVAYPGNRMAAVEGIYLVAGFGWGLFLLAYMVGMILLRSRKSVG